MGWMLKSIKLIILLSISPIHRSFLSAQLKKALISYIEFCIRNKLKAVIVYTNTEMLVYTYTDDAKADFTKTKQTC